MDDKTNLRHLIPAEYAQHLTSRYNIARRSESLHEELDAYLRIMLERVVQLAAKRALDHGRLTLTSDDIMHAMEQIPEMPRIFYGN